MKYISAFVSVVAAAIAYYFFQKDRKKNEDDAVSINKKTSSENIDSFAWLTTNYGVKYPLQVGRNDIGRYPQTKYNSIQIMGVDGPDRYMSRLHFSILVLQNDEGAKQFFIYDEKSTNGTFINNQSIGKELLEISDGVEITAGQTRILFKTDNHDESPEIVKSSKGH